VGADQIKVVVGSVNDLTSQNRENINQLVKQASRFKVE
jgi:hypothetical protein